MAFRSVIHGSLRRHLAEIRRAVAVFRSAGIEVLAPKIGPVAAETDGFVFFGGEARQDRRLVELLYLRNLKRLGENGFSYFVDPDGYLGTSASYELGIAQATNVPCFFLAKPADHPVYLHPNSVWSPEDLAAFIAERGRLPAPVSAPDEAVIHRLWEELVAPGSVVAAGGIIRHRPARGEEELLFVRTHKWGGRYSMVGGKLRRRETLLQALRREIREETGLAARVDRHLCTFDQIKDSGYWLAGLSHIFVDYAVTVDSKRVTLNEEAEDFVWLPAGEALQALELEPNARRTLELYRQTEFLGLAASGVI
jgi:ADP-ribose pyrophosphatase YjhB (NUDIX family)